MDNKTRIYMNHFGKIGKFVITVILTTTGILTILCGAAAIKVESFPDKAVEVRVTNHAEFQIDKKIFSSIWGVLTQNYEYTTDSDPTKILEDDTSFIGEDNTTIKGEFQFLNQKYSSAFIQTDGNHKLVDASSSEKIYRSSDFGIVLILAIVFLVFVFISLLMLHKVFSVLSVCESPFYIDFVNTVKRFGYSLVPLIVFSSIGETMAVRFLSAGTVTGISIQWGLLIAFIVTMFLVKIFQYGVLLQKESDETL